MLCVAILGLSLPRTRVPHISLVFREMWDTANLDLPLLIVMRRPRNVKNIDLSSVVPHISRKTSLFPQPLKSCPDTKRSFPAACSAVRFLQSPIISLFSW